PRTLAPATLGAALGRLLPGAAPPRIEVLDGYDSYYYARAPHTMLGHVEKPLPVWRVVYDDPRG
ncbi:hypothetical protein BRL57_06505, partial [Bordetella bronchiseptica]|nr:hypothetical protein [Bordetella bronchiseptica]